MSPSRVGSAILLLALAAQADATPAAIALRERAVVDGPRVRVLDVVVDGARLARSEPRSAELALWSAPLPCKTARVSRAEVAARLHELHVVGNPNALTGSESVVVERACHPVTAETLRTAASATLAAWLAPQVARYELAAVEPVPTLELAEPAATLVARPLEAARPLTARMPVWIDVVAGGRVVRSLPVFFDVRAFADVWSATCDLHADHLIAAGDLVKTELDLAAAGLGAATIVAAPAQSARLRKPLLAGQVLTVAHLQGALPLRNGARVTARSRAGGVAVEASAEALQDGRLGDRVWVRIAGATAPVRARVVDTSLVEVERD